MFLGSFLIYARKLIWSLLTSKGFLLTEDFCSLFIDKEWEFLLLTDGFLGYKGLE